MAKRKRNRTRKIKPFTILQKTYMIAGVLILAGMITVYGSAMIVLKGPSVTVSNLLTSTMMETRTLKSIARLFFSEEEMETIMNRNSVSDTDEITDSETDFVIDESKKDKIEIIDIKGPTYEGKLMIVYDPSRIHLAVNSDLGNSNEGYFVEEYVKANDAIAGINAGGFDDPNGQGTSGIPYGIVIQDGELVSGGLDDYNSVIGFNEQNKLIVGNMTGRQALEYGLRDAVTFKPIFIVNYVPVEVTGTGGGVNPRTVIGQREDGAVLLLVIDGRQTTSLGASYSDCIDIMTQYGAMNAANLDGGSSSVMVYDGQIINNVVSMNGDRKVPTAFIVK
ncbi:phosphodiester glycosidase family protein [Holdemania filiformis]|uniref:phosphodiester glycosidase family protein n=1 Tax=Holdemania filiformis TaxID=61171 RepID=UPI003A95D35F